MALHVRRPYYRAETGIALRRINRASRQVYDTIGQTPSLTKPIVGLNAFAHESGIHTHGLMTDPSTYEIMDPAELGIPKVRIVLGKHSGKHAVAERLTEMGYLYTEEELNTCYQRLMELSDQKKYIGDSDLEAILLNKRRAEGTYRLESFDVHTNKFTSSTCVIKLRRENEVVEEVSLGRGPINAAYNAIDKITGHICEEMRSYQIHSISDGNDALGEVTVKLRSGDRFVTGRGLSTDIIESSILAYLNGINKLIDMQ
jgi:2-isopropylmalate synthase